MHMHMHICTCHMRVHRYAICLSLLDGGRPVVGLLGCPNLSPTDARASAAVGCAAGGTLAWAVRGGGAFASAALQEPRLPEAAARERHRRPTRVSAAVAPARVVRCEAFEAAHSSRGKAAAAAAALGLTAEPGNRTRTRTRTRTLAVVITLTLTLSLASAHGRPGQVRRARARRGTALHTAAARRLPREHMGRRGG